MKVFIINVTIFVKLTEVIHHNNVERRVLIMKWAVAVLSKFAYLNGLNVMGGQCCVLCIDGVASVAGVPGQWQSIFWRILWQICDFCERCRSLRGADSLSNNK